MTDQVSKSIKPAAESISDIFSIAHQHSPYDIVADTKKAKVFHLQLKVAVRELEDLYPELKPTSLQCPTI